jgi:hypothetical protein
MNKTKLTLWIILCFILPFLLAVLPYAFGTAPTADINHDGLVNLIDHSIIADQWLTTGYNSPSEFSPVSAAGIYSGVGMPGQIISLPFQPVHIIIHALQPAEGRTGVEVISINWTPGSGYVAWKQSSSTVFDYTDIIPTDYGFYVGGTDSALNKIGVTYLYYVEGYR